MLPALGGGADSRTKEGKNPERCDYPGFGLISELGDEKIGKEVYGLDQRKISSE
jgi:hypothetical protein